MGLAGWRRLLWAAVAVWAAGLAVWAALALPAALRGPLPLTPSQAATAADAGARLLPAGRAPQRTLAAILPDGRMARMAVAAADGGARLVDFFATWCHACSLDLRVLKAYGARARTDGLPPPVAVDLRLAEPSTGYVVRFVHGQGLDFPVLLDATGTVTDAYGVTDLPTVVLVDGAGHVRWRHVGVLTLSALVAAVRAHAPSAQAAGRT
ncbi:MAG: TlpA family protein disulfide reductase [Firmicutes bacterium]|nr:TlpA family protein disulfide reductase [Bacillota bacterium]